ncbi:serine hydrolase [Phenylobacterium sp.]|uniref:serine hydrolase n=1 Tax=Phenylobacterium sp. TaxID=1871053 RepID=UPI002EDB99E5
MGGRVRGAAIALSVMLAAGPAVAQDLSQAPSGQYVRRWLDAMNDPDPAALVKVDPRAFPMRAESGGLDLVAVEQATDAQVVAVVRERISGRYMRATWSFGPDGALTNWRGAAMAPPPGAPAVGRLDDKALGAFISDYMTKTDFSGAVVVARDGKPVFTAARGLADREAGTPNTLESRFRVGSMNKMMTAVAILQLVQAGKVKLDAPVGAYLKDYPNGDVAQKVTVWQLLTHTGGVGDIFGPKYFEKRLEVKTLKDYVALYGDRGPEFAPGTRHKYANYGFILLGRIVEEASGQPYADYVRDRIFRPAGMTRSGFAAEDVAVEGRTKGYTVTAEGFRSNADSLPYSGTSAGGGYSTVGDFLAFANALTSHRLLDAAHTRLLTTRKVNGSYAFGFMDSSTDELRVYGHGGGAPGMNGELRIVGDGQAVVVVLTNVAPPGRASQLTSMILQRATFRTKDGRVAALPPVFNGRPSEPVRLAAFKANDRNGDGRLDAPEFRAMVASLGYAELAESMFAQRDVDKDGFVSAAEHAPPPA